MGAKPPDTAVNQPPFRKENQLHHSPDVLFPGIRHRTFCSRSTFPPASRQSVTEDLLCDICPFKLNRLAPYLWMCSAPTYTNIPALHEHAVHGRTIIVSEDPSLHLVWTTGRSFIKPVPLYLLSYDFWNQFLLDDHSLVDETHARQAAMGLLRSYHVCIRHESDLRVAQQPHLHLLPPEVTWKQWCDFSQSFGAIENNEVAPRYHYGKLQLSRLHWLVRIYQRQLTYYYIDGSYGDSFARYYGPLLFVFGLLSVLLSAMQVGMAVEQLQSHDWMAFWSVCRWFSVTSLLVSAVVAFHLIISFMVKSVDEMMWAVRAQFRARPRLKPDGIGE